MTYRIIVGTTIGRPHGKSVSPLSHFFDGINARPYADGHWPSLQRVSSASLLHRIFTCVFGTSTSAVPYPCFLCFACHAAATNRAYCANGSTKALPYTHFIFLLCRYLHFIIFSPSRAIKKTGSEFRQNVQGVIETVVNRIPLYMISTAIILIQN